MGNMEWVEKASKDIAKVEEVCEALTIVPGTEELIVRLRRIATCGDKLIAAVRLAEIGWAVALSDLQRAIELFADEERIQCDYLRAIIANKALYARLRSGDMGG